MNRFKFEAFLKEFPFLKEILEEKKRDYQQVDSIRVARIDENLLLRTLEEYHYDGSAGETYNWEELWAVLPDGTVQVVPTQDECSSDSNYAHSQPRHEEGQPIIEALVGLEETHYLVLLERELENWPGREYVNEFNVTIYKPSRSTSLSKEIEKARRKATIEVKAGVDF